MDLTHRRPFPSPDLYHNFFNNPDANGAYRDSLSKNVDHSSTSLMKLSRLIPTFDESEIFAAFVSARYNMQANSVKIRYGALHLLNEILKTSLKIHAIPYIFILAHDDQKQIKNDASESFTRALKEIGGIKNCLQVMISAIGSMGFESFDELNNVPIEQLMGKSRLAVSVILSAIQMLNSFKNSLNRSNTAELVQFIKIAIDGWRTSMESKKQSYNLFYNQRLRCCLYRLRLELIHIKGCPSFSFNDLLNEVDEDCLLYVIQLIKNISKEEIDFSKLLNNRVLLNRFLDEFIENVSNDIIKNAIEEDLLDDKNLIVVVNYMFEKGNSDFIPMAHIASVPQIWKDIPINVVEAATKENIPVDAKYIILYPQFFKTFESIDQLSQIDDIAKAVSLISNSQEIPFIIQKFPNAVIKCIKLWNKSPITDWFCDEFQKRIDAFVEESPMIVKSIIPSTYLNQFTKIVDSVIKKKIEESKPISSDLWEFTGLTDDLCEIIIKNQIEIEVTGPTKQKLYSKLYAFIKSNYSESDAGQLIGHISAKLNLNLLDDFPNSYDFMKNYFTESQIKNAPVSMSLRFLSDYLTKEFPNFGVTVYTNSFSISKMSTSVTQFLNTLEDEKRQNLLEISISNNMLYVSLLLIITSNSILKVPHLMFFAPFLYKIPKYSKWFEDILFQTNDTTDKNFLKLLSSNGKDKAIFPFDYEYILFCTGLSNVLSTDDLYNAISNKLNNNINTLNFYLILESLLKVEQNLSKFQDVLIQLLTYVNKLSINTATKELMSKVFYISTEFQSEELISFSSKLSPLFNDCILYCFEKSLPIYISKLNIDQCLRFRNSLSNHSISALLLFDDYLSVKFDDKRNNLEMLLYHFPNAASKWFHKYPNDKIKQYVLTKISPKLIKQVIDSTIEDISCREISTEIIDNNIILCKCQKDDDLFKLKITIPLDYPLSLPMYEIFSIGKETLTRECRDEVIRESNRSSGIVSAINTWKTRILSIFSNESPCPICFSLLDENGDLPKMRCLTCHRCCHSTCIKKWWTNSDHKICPWCRSTWKKQHKNHH